MDQRRSQMALLAALCLLTAGSLSYAQRIVYELHGSGSTTATNELGEVGTGLSGDTSVGGGGQPALSIQVVYQTKSILC